MRKAIIGIAILTTAVIAYAAVGPFITLRQIRSALEKQDPEKLSENIDFPTLRQNLKEQLTAFVMKEAASDMQGNPFGGLALALAPTLVDGMIDSFVTPSGLASLMEGKTPQGYTNQGPGSSRTEPAYEEREPPKATMPKAAPLPTQLANGKQEPFNKARYTYDSISKFSVWLDADQGGQIRLVLTRDGLNWKLTNIVISDLYKRRRTELNEQAEVVLSLRTILTAEVTYATSYNLGYSATLSCLGPSSTGTPDAQAAGLLDSELATGTKNGYRFTYVPGEPDRMNGWIRAYTVRADPVQPGETGNYHYFTDQSGIIRVDSQQEANADSPPVTDPKSAWRDEEMCAAGSEPGGSIVPNSEQVAKPTDLLLQVTATERLWVAVDADGKTVLQKVLSPNEVEKPEGARLL